MYPQMTSHFPLLKEIPIWVGKPPIGRSTTRCARTGRFVPAGNETAMLSIDVQNIYMEIPDDAREQARWAPFHKRMREIM